jgi:hypothetical protein
LAIDHDLDSGDIARTKGRAIKEPTRIQITHTRARTDGSKDTTLRYETQGEQEEEKRKKSTSFFHCKILL